MVVITDITPDIIIENKCITENNTDTIQKDVILYALNNLCNKEKYIDNSGEIEEIKCAQQILTDRLYEIKTYDNEDEIGAPGEVQWAIELSEEKEEVNDNIWDHNIFKIEETNIGTHGEVELSEEEDNMWKDLFKIDEIDEKIEEVNDEEKIDEDIYYSNDDRYWLNKDIYNSDENLCKNNKDTLFDSSDEDLYEIIN